MEGIAAIAKAFDFDYKTISREKYGILCHGASGYKKILRYNLKDMPPEDITFVHKAKETLYESGFKNIDRFLISDGLPYIIKADDVFLVTDLISLNEANFNNPAEFLDIVKNLAQMHSLWINMGIAKGIDYPNNFENSRALTRVRGYRNKVMKGGHFSDFDMLFIEGEKSLTPYIEQYTALSDDFGLLFQTAREQGQVCHNLLKEENIINTGDGHYFTNFMRARPYPCIYDLVYIIKRYLRALQQPVAASLTLDEIAEAYSKSNPHFEYNKELLCAMLLYPDKFIKISDQYYSKKRGFVPIAYMQRLKDIISTKDMVLQFVKGE